MTFQEENNALLKYLIDNLFINVFDVTDEKARATSNRLEIFVTPTCNQVCDYCYVMKHGNELYPFSLLNDAKMIDNLKKILVWLKLNNRTMEVFDLFSGEIWSDPLGYMILDVFLEFYKDYRVSSSIVIPSNMSFLFAPNGEEKMQWYIDEFKKIGTRLVFSASIDGIYLEDKFRRFKHKEDTINIPRNQEYYEKIFEFCAKNRFLFHPMVAAKSCKRY